MMFLNTLLLEKLARYRLQELYEAAQHSRLEHQARAAHAQRDRRLSRWWSSISQMVFAARKPIL